MYSTGNDLGLGAVRKQSDDIKRQSPYVNQRYMAANPTSGQGGDKDMNMIQKLFAKIFGVSQDQSGGAGDPHGIDEPSYQSGSTLFQDRAERGATPLLSALGFDGSILDAIADKHPGIKEGNLYQFLQNLSSSKKSDKPKTEDSGYA